MTGIFSTGTITLTGAIQKVRKMIQGESMPADVRNDQILNEIMQLVEIGIDTSRDGWRPQTARLYALDVAMMVVHRNLNVVSEASRQILFSGLREARALVVWERDNELGFIQGSLESQLALTREGRERRVWLTAIDALLPSPYRAALICTRDSLNLGATASFSNVSSLLRDRLVARLDEGNLLAQPAPPLYLIA